MFRPRTVADPEARSGIVARLHSPSPDTPRHWGTMSAPQMIAHLTDQMRHTLGISRAEPRRGPLRWPGMRWTSIYLVPWPKGRIKGPREAFLTQPASWDGDLLELESMLDTFASRDPKGAWPEHALMGPMSGRDWGYFIFKHFDHHLRQFGA